MRCNLAFVIAASAILIGGCASTTKSPLGQPPSFTDKLGASVKSGTSKIAAIVSPKPAPGTDVAMQLPKKPNPAVFVALAEMRERSGNFEEAETQLRKALEIDPNHLGALLAYAHLEDRQKNLEAATGYYKRALKKHAKDATVHNDMGLCYHRRGMLNEAAKSLATAVELAPHKKLYRDNLAAVLVDQGKTGDALVQLTKAHGEPVGNYNLAYLLVQKRDNAAALHHFQRAAQLDPSLSAAQHWIAQLSPGQAPVATRPVAMVARRDGNPGYAPGSIVNPAAAPAPGANVPGGNPYYPPAGYAPPPAAGPPGYQPWPAQPPGAPR